MTSKIKDELANAQRRKLADKKKTGTRGKAASVDEQHDDEHLFPDDTEQTDYDYDEAADHGGEVHTVNVHAMRHGIDRVHRLERQGN